MSGWPERCTLMGCLRPGMRPHHHHFHRGHPACDGRAWDDDTDDVTTCTCTCHEEVP